MKLCVVCNSWESYGWVNRFGTKLVWRGGQCDEHALGITPRRVYSPERWYGPAMVPGLCRGARGDTLCLLPDTASGPLGPWH